MRHKVRNGQNLPHESQNFTKKKIQSNFTYNLSHFSTSLRPQTVFSKYFFCFLLQTPGCLRTCVFGVTNCLIPKRASVQLLQGQMNLDLIIAVQGSRCLASAVGHSRKGEIRTMSSLLLSGVTGEITQLH